MASVAEFRAVPDRVFNGYLYPLFAWAAGLLFLFALQSTPFALWLCFPLAVWYGLLSLWWARQAHQRRKAEDLTPLEVRAGVQSVGRFLAGASLLPALVFMAIDPMTPSTWGTCAGIGIVALIAWVLVAVLPKLDRRITHGLAMLAAWAALPINATGALSLARWLGWFDEVRSAVGV